MQHTLELLGVAVSAVGGVLAAGRKGLDLFGAAVIAWAASLGGGTLRDLLLDRHPIFWIADPAYLLALFAALVTALAYLRLWVASQRALLVADALALALFGIGGVRIAQDLGHSPVISVLMGVVTGVFGGVLRDIFTAEIPLVLRPGQLYATAVLAGSILYLVLSHIGVPGSAAALAGMACIAGLRLAAIAWNLKLPKVSLPDD